jgi:photosystem II stability/assembly factor-like uncharacterized protein
MKKLLISFAIALLMVFFSLSLFSQPLELFKGYNYKKALTDFIGVAYNGISILAYGANGRVLYSTDGGASWQGSEITDTLDIAYVTNNSEKFVALSTNGTIWESTNNGKDWNYRQSISGYNCYKLEFSDNTPYILAKNKILGLSAEYEIVKEYEFTPDTSVYDFTINNNVLYYTARKGKIGVIELNNGVRKEVDLRSYGVCVDCPAPKNLGAYDASRIYFLLGSKLFLFNYYTNSIDSIVLVPSPRRAFAKYKNNFLNFHSYTPWRIDSLRTYLIDVENKQVVTIGAKCDRFLKGTVFASARWIGGDTVVAVGPQNLVFISYDGGKNWIVASFYDPNIDNFLIISHDTIRVGYPKHNFGFTNDVGDRWLCLRNGLDVFEELEWIDRTTIFKDKNNGLGRIKSHAVYITNDGGNTCYLKSGIELLYGEKKYYPPPYKNLSYIILTTSYKDTTYDILHFLDDTAGIVKRSYTTNLNVVPLKNPDTWNDTLFALTFPKGQKNYSISYSLDTGTTWTNYYTFTLEGNYLTDWFKLYKITDNFFIFSKLAVNDSVAYHKLFWFNWSKRTFDTLLVSLAQIETLNNFGRMMKLNDTTFAIVYSYFSNGPEFGLFVNYNFYKDPYNWQKYDYSGKRYRIANMFGSNLDSVLLVFIYDTLYRNSTAYIFWKEKVSSVVETPQVEASPSFLLGQPMPNPSNGTVRFKLYFDYKYDISEFRFECYNLLGVKVIDWDGFRTSLLNRYTAEVTLSTVELPRGYYCVVVRLGKETRTLPIIVE